MNITLTFSLLMMLCPLYQCIGSEPVVSENSAEIELLLLPEELRSDHREKAKKIPQWVDTITTQLERMTVLAQLQDPTSPQAINQHKGKAKKVLGSDQDADRLAKLIEQTEKYCEKLRKKKMADPQRQIVQQALNRVSLLKTQLAEFNCPGLCAQSFASSPSDDSQQSEDEDAHPIRIHSMPLPPGPGLPFPIQLPKSPPSAQSPLSADLQSPLSRDPRSPRSALSPVSPHDGPGV